MSPETSNRERLLRLIDGGPEALKAALDEKTPKNEPKPAAAAKPAFTLPKIRVSLSGTEVLTLAKIGVVLGLALAVLHYGSEVLKSRPAPVGAPASFDPSGTGLRLVGVDSSEPPVALLEDLVTGKTHFARKNDRVKDARIKDIQKNKVTLSVHGKTVELR